MSSADCTGIATLFYDANEVLCTVHQAKNAISSVKCDLFSLCSRAAHTRHQHCVASCKPLDALLSFWISIWPHIYKRVGRKIWQRSAKWSANVCRQAIYFNFKRKCGRARASERERTYVCARCLDRCGENEMKSRKIAANYLTGAIRNGWINHGCRVKRPMCVENSNDLWNMCARDEVHNIKHARPVMDRHSAANIN